MKYIDSQKLIAKIERRMTENCDATWRKRPRHSVSEPSRIMTSLPLSPLQQGQPANMIQWTGNNLKEVIDFTGKSPRFEEWFKSWEEFETYVHQHNDILKLFCEDGSHYEVPKGAWIVKTPDGYNVPSVAKYIQQEQPKVDLVAELKHHLATTPKEQLEKEWKELEPWNNVGPTVQEFLYGKQPEVDLEKLGEIARHIIAVKENVEDMRLNEDEWSVLERIGYPERFNARKK